MTNSRTKCDIELRYAWRRCDEPDSLTKQQHSDCRCRQLEPSRSRLAETCAPADRAIKPLSLHQTHLHILLRSLRWLCTPEVLTSKNLLHCRIWNNNRLLTCDCPHSRWSPSQCNRLRLKLSVITRLEPITCCYTGRVFTVMLYIVIRRILFSFMFY